MGFDLRALERLDMIKRVDRCGLQVAEVLSEMLENEVLPYVGVDKDIFWSGLSLLLEDMTPINHSLLQKRDEFQVQLDGWHKQSPGQPKDISLYKKFLEKIGYIAPSGDDFVINTQNLDPEISDISAPQLVVPVKNARFALNAANARWGSLFDALYGTDVIPLDTDQSAGGGYNSARGDHVIAYSVLILDQIAPLLESGSYGDIIEYRVENGTLKFKLKNGDIVHLEDKNTFVGYRLNGSNLEAVLLVQNGLHIEIQIDARSQVGKQHPAGVKDILLESALTTIQDCEDSVVAVDADDKVEVYRNWLGLMRGDLKVKLTKNGKVIERKLGEDRVYLKPDGAPLTLPGRSLLLVRNVGHLMMSDMILDSQGNETPEGILDALITSAIALFDIKGLGQHVNSRAGSIYIVKPKMHGAEEVDFTNTVFSRVEDILGVRRHTIKVGIMDEERRTTLNLKECIRAVKDRVFFINTGFLDRTGDEIRTSMYAGPVVRKEAMKEQPWIDAYEKRNVNIGLETGFQGRAQIGKGMWAKPDEMAEMLKVKINHPRAGASCAWVPSPTAATLHAVHYHQVLVTHQQKNIIESCLEIPSEDILTLPLLPAQTTLSADEIQQELNNNAQGILGYVVRWINQGIGCSRVPDINGIGLMEDRATLRISSQHMANWLKNKIITQQQTRETMMSMAKIVDQQNADDQNYIKMGPNFDQSIAFKAACDLVLLGAEQPNGYTEPLLQVYRRMFKEQNIAKQDCSADVV